MIAPVRRPGLEQATIPVRVVSVEGYDALCEDAAGNQAEIAVELVAPVQTGEVLLTHGGVAIGRIGAEKLMTDS